MEDTRRIALNALHNITLGEKPRDAIDALSEGLQQRDRAFVMELVYGVLRYRDMLDWMLGRFLTRPGKLDGKTVDILRLGAYQIFFMRVPEWAAVNEAVELAPKRPLVNAVLRNALRNKEPIQLELQEMEKAAASDSTDVSLRISNIATVTSHPKWLVKRWVKRFGLDEAMALAKANNAIPPLTLRANTLRITRDDLLSKIKDSQPTKWSPDGIAVTGGQSFMELRPTIEGLAMAQDEAAQLITYLLDPKPGERVLDACAAPGGKTTHIAQLMKDRGEIVAVEKDVRRIPRLRENIDALGIKSVRIINADILEIKGGLRPPFDKVLLDAPCSALGTIRRNPDIKYRHKGKDLLECKAQQVELLRAASGLVKKGGVIVYAVCSTEPEEGEDVIADFLKSPAAETKNGKEYVTALQDRGESARGRLKSSADFHIIKEAPALFGDFMTEGYFSTYPHRHGMDGFFGARLKRVE